MMWRPNCAAGRRTPKCMLNSTNRHLLPALCLVLMIFCSLVSAQSTGSVKGKIKNMDGGAISGATITARLGSRDVGTARSGSKGEFYLDGLDEGTYNFVFDAKGYASGIKYSVEIKANKTKDLGDRLILMIDRGSFVIVQGSVFFNDGTSVRGIDVRVEKVKADGSAQKLATLVTNDLGEFTFRRPEGAAKYRMTVKYGDTVATKEIEVESAAVYRTVVSLPVSREK